MTRYATPDLVDVLAACSAQLRIMESRLATVDSADLRVSDQRYLAKALLPYLSELIAINDQMTANLPHADERASNSAAGQLVTRWLANQLATKAPGRSVEVRIPPFAVVQCIEGPTHTRGTPPNVVETDPATWIQLATGRLDWQNAVASGKIRASGSRSDLSPYLPLLSSGPANGPEVNR